MATLTGSPKSHSGTSSPAGSELRSGDVLIMALTQSRVVSSSPDIFGDGVFPGGSGLPIWEVRVDSRRSMLRVYLAADVIWIDQVEDLLRPVQDPHAQAPDLLRAG